MHNALVQRSADGSAEAPHSADTTVTPFEQFQKIHEYALKVFEQMDAIPLELLRVGENFMRAQRKMRQQRTADALVKQQRYDLMRRQIENHFTAIAQFRRVKIAPTGLGAQRNVAAPAEQAG